MSTQKETKAAERNGVELEIVDIIQLNSELILIQKEDLPFLLKYNLSKMYEQTRTFVRLFEDQKTKLVRKYGKKIKNDDGDDVWTLSGCKEQDKAMEELKALQYKKEFIDGNLNLSEFEELKSDQIYLQLMKFLH